MTKRLYDCFTFFNELDLLELRLNELYEHVDYFVLAEAPVTFKGQPKELFYANNKARFEKFHDKIIHLIIEDMPVSENPWDLEHFQRNALRRGFATAAADDIIIIADADEIIKPSTAAALRSFSQIQMTMYQYYMNLREQNGWTKVFAFSRDLLAQLPDFNWVRTSQEDCFNHFAGDHQKLPAAGWHFTYLGGAAKIREKLNTFSHNETWFQQMLTPGGIEAQLAAGFEVGNFWHLNRFCEIDQTYPHFVRNNLEKYKSLGFIRDPYDAIATLQLQLRNAYQIIQQERQKRIDSETKYGVAPPVVRFTIGGVKN
ncbi:MAG TPA: hypothetical protein PLT25_08445 [Acidocella sp.]|nr:hypothetical protein [Acidocella sp.]